MNRAQHIGTGVVEDLVAALQAAEVVEGQLRRLQHRAHRAVADDDAPTQGVQKRGVESGGEDGRHVIKSSGTYRHRGRLRRTLVGPTTPGVPATDRPATAAQSEAGPRVTDAANLRKP
ncbi:hypothetical protein GCM10023318_26400 [Nocardia callitridis]|uniref:Uncharacterized protein n=1 Tax=Nocardia callitridis TaxID=648753 RepID=A0ABP9KAT7_9NOCA